MRSKLASAALAAALIFTVAACESGTSSSEDERSRQQDGYDRLTSSQPAGSMEYSPSRETINFWIDTWDEPNKLSYVYLMAADGSYIGYYILQGLPVSYCAMLTPPYEFERPYGGSNGSNGHLVPAPAMDGIYYAGEGSCNTYYGVDASTGSYIEYTAGMGINVLLYDQPLALQTDIPALGFTEVGEEDTDG